MTHWRSSPSDAQTAAELSTTPRAVRRLIAIGVLAAVRTPEKDGEWKVTPNPLGQYVASGTRRAAVPLSNHDNSEFDDRELFHFSGRFETEVQAVLASNLPDVLPVTTLKANQSHTLPLPADMVKRVRELGSQPAQW